jgi:SAM-dependent methyltransferase
MNFDQFAGDYTQILDRSVAISGEDSVYFAEYKARYLWRLLGPSFSGKALEFGCGVGLTSGFIKKLLPGIQLDGFDVSSDSIRNVGHTLSDQGIFTCNFDDLAYDYRLIVVANVLHHIHVDERTSVVRNLANRMSNGARLAIFEHNPANPVTRWVVNHCPFDSDAVLLRPREIKTYLLDAGLRLLRCDFIVFLPRLISALRPLEPLLAKVPFGAQYVMVAEKHA